MQRVLITGASGFIGQHLAESLRQRGSEVYCLVRSSSNRARLSDLNCRFVEADVLSEDAVAAAVKSIKPNTIFHLAGVTKSLQKQILFNVNQAGARNVFAAGANQTAPPTIVFVSTLAAAGPSARPSPTSASAKPVVETDPPKPVSNYGRSKLAGESQAMAFCDQVPITVVRLPIVFGPHDKDTFELFQTISKSGLHPVPSLRPMSISWIQVRDACEAIIASANAGRRMSGATPRDGIYFGTSDEIVDYAELGKRVAHSLGRQSVFCVPTPGPFVWCLAAINELFARMRGRQNILNFDKAREATAGSWTCSGEKLKRETGFSCQVSLTETLAESAAWYREAGWF